MAKITILFGVLLIVLGAVCYQASGTHAPTALIPTWFGVALAVLGAGALTRNAKLRMTLMHIAVTVGLIGFLFPFFRSIRPAIEMLQGHAVLRPLATEESMAMALLCLVFTALCVNSFIQARRNRTV